MSESQGEIVARRAAALDTYIESFDGKAVEKQKSLDLSVHRFIAVERETVTTDCYMSGHKTARAACEALSREVETCRGWSPMFLIDLDSGERQVFNIIAFVFPEGVDGVGVVLPRSLAESVVTLLGGGSALGAAQAVAVIQRAIDGS